MARLVNCVKLGKEAEGLDFAPYPGELGKKIFETNHISDQQTQFFVEKSEYYFNGNKIIPIANQWDLIRD